MLFIGLGLVISSALLISSSNNNKNNTVAQEDKVVATATCDAPEHSNTVNAALPLLQSGNSEEISKTIKSIESFNGYREDPNCMYILTTLYTNNVQPDKAQEALDQLKNVYISDKAIQNRFGPYAVKMSILEKNVRASKVQLQQIKSNTGILY